MTALVELPEFEGQGEVLKPYVPRLLIEWVRDSPEIPHRQVEGALAFVDISGFTALTERLARRGKVGAEILRDTLDGVFNALLDEAYQWGAGLIKWGGDALLLLFDGPGHEARAARAAWEMQRTIERVGRIRVGGGTVTLRMSIGITSGPIDFFTAGSVHRELLVVGPTATETAEIEAAAEAGEIGISSGARPPPRPVVCRPAAGRRAAARRAAGRRSAAGARRGRRQRPRRGVVHPDRLARPRAARAERARAPHDHRSLHRPDGHGRPARAPRSSRVRAGARAAHQLDPGGGASPRGALQSHGHLEGEREDAAHRRGPVEHRSRRGADAPHAARGDGRARRGADAGRRQHGPGLHRRLRPPLPPRLQRVRRRDQHGCAGHGSRGDRVRSSPPRSCSSGRAPPLRRHRSRRSWPRARPSRSQPRSSGRSSGEGASAAQRRPSSAGTPSSRFCSASSKTSGKETAGSSRSAAPPVPVGHVSSRSSSTVLRT